VSNTISVEGQQTTRYQINDYSGLEIVHSGEFLELIILRDNKRDGVSFVFSKGEIVNRKYYKNGVLLKSENSINVSDRFKKVRNDYFVDSILTNSVFHLNSIPLL